MTSRNDAEEKLLEKARRYLPGGNGGNLCLLYTSPSPRD